MDLARQADTAVGVEADIGARSILFRIITSLARNMRGLPGEPLPPLARRPDEARPDDGDERHFGEDIDEPVPFLAKGLVDFPQEKRGAGEPEELSGEGEQAQRL